MTQRTARMGATNRPAAPVKKKPVVDPWPEKIRRKSTAQLRSKSPHAVKLLSESLENNSGWCIKKSVVGWDEVVKPLDDNDRKIQFSGAMDLASASQEFSESSGVTHYEGNGGSCKRKKIRRPYVGTLPNDSIIKHGKNTSLQMGEAVCMKEHLSKFVNWPESVRKKRSFYYHNQLAKTLENTLGSVWHGKHQKLKGARERFGTLSTHSFPEEVVEQILSRLPVKSLARFRCVCKSWHHLSYSKRFISLHLKNYNSTSQLLVGTCCVLDKISSMYFLPPPPPPTGGYDGVQQKMVKRFPKELLGGSCNGIVCLYTKYADEYIALWNPATNEFKYIRKSGFRRNQRICLCTVGFGFDPKTNDYKILQMVYDYPNSPVSHMELYSLRKGSWKKVDSHDFRVVRNVSPADVTCSLPFTDNRIVCAVVSPVNGTSKWEILSFDMSSEMYEIIPVSPTLDAELGDHDPFGCRKTHFKLFPFKESIALGIVYRVGNGSYCDVWVLNGFNFVATSRSWSKLLSTDINDGNTVPVGCWGSSQIIFQEKWSKRVVCLDHGSNTMVELGVVPPACVTATEYKESLVRIKDIPEPVELRYLFPPVNGWGDYSA